MKPSPLLVAGALALASGNLLAYQIVESRFHVEVAPNKFVDQLVLRCEDGRQVTVPWQSKLAESCGEDLMGNVTLPPPSSAPIDEQQKQAMLEQLRSQYGNISEKQVEFISTPAGISTRFKPPIVEVLKKYESCRKALKDKSYCAGERDKALARLADPKPTASARPPESPETAALEPVPAATVPEASARQPGTGSAPKEATLQAAASTPAPTEATPKPTRAAPMSKEPTRKPAQAMAVATEPTPKPTQTAPASAEATPKPTQAAASTEATPNPTQAAPVAPAAAEPPPAQPSEAELRAAAEQKVNQDYMACLRAKPKFDCDQGRTKAMTALDKPKSQKPQRKPASKPVEPQAQR
jgi:hypothetical protein